MNRNDLQVGRTRRYAPPISAAVILGVVALTIAVSVPASSAALAQTTQDSLSATGVEVEDLKDFPTTFDPLTYGENEYRRSCAGCHGTEGLGDGLMAGKITPAPPNLQQITEQAGGRFPLNRVYRIIDGREELKAHGSPDMPIWGNRFNAQAAGDLGPDANRAIQDMVAATRTMSLVFFLESIQPGAGGSD